ncbi:MAG: uracil phosphoribosyltransferase [Muribaculaceae bacterium]|nr:uracil phosphoribosyltransferase [Muribaculaceae bacterium]MBQ3961615.1 uracil phosphoribosyltransferase [Muribaculaceae bacterium]MBQ4007022.1 uracil phosphoribosyltransferase [Muribaculaceae bacterium]
MEVINLCNQNSLVSQFMSELRDCNQQQERLRFRANIQRIGQIMAYEISKRLSYELVETVTPLGTAKTNVLADNVVLTTILRAGLPFHEGFLTYFDHAENGFVSAYRKYIEQSNDFKVHIEYIACPRIDDKVVIIADPMLATGSSMELAYQALMTKGHPKHVHLASVIATDQAIDFISERLPKDNITLWTADIDHELNDHSYIVPGLGDAGDLLYGEKE